MNELIGEIGLLPAVKDMSGYENYLAKMSFSEVSRLQRF